MNRNHLRFLPLPILALTLALLAAPAAAEVYIVNLKNGNQFLSKYKPIQASYDPQMLLVMTDVGNTIAIAKDSVDEVINDSEHRGFGTVLDTSTVMIGYTANDAPDLSNPETVEALNQQFARQQFESQFAPAPAYNSPLVAQPNQGGGIPVSFAASGAVPVSAAQGAVPPN